MNTNVILFYLGKVPQYIQHTIKQVQYVDPTAQIWFIGDAEVVADVNYMHVKDLLPHLTRDLSKLTYFSVNPDAFSARLFHTSALRFFYIEALMQKESLTNCFTFDCDVLVYQPFYRVVDLLKPSTEIAITAHYPEEYVCGMMFIKQVSSLKKTCDFFFKCMHHTEQELKPLTKIMPHEMRLLKLASDMQPQQRYSLLPTMPHESKVIFDPGSYGIWLDGNFINRKPGDYYDYFDVGKALAAKTLTISKETPPTVTDAAGNTAILFNLHIHTKNLDKFISYAK